MEGVAQVDEAADLLGAVRGHRAGIEARVVRPHADRVAREPCQPHDLRTTEAGARLEEGTRVDDGRDQTPRVVYLAPIARDDREQRLVPPLRVVVASGHRGELPDVGREVGEEATDLCEGGILALRHVVHDTTSPGNRGATERLLR